MEKYRTLIADDEQPARDRLRHLLSEYPEKIEIIGEAENGTECRIMIETLKPDLVFLDIQMPGLDGFEVLKNIGFQPVIVFCTAYDEYALKAFETNSIDYIVKPVKAERILKTIEKLDLLRKNSTNEDLNKLLEAFEKLKPKKEITSIPVKLGDRMLFIDINEILYFEAEDKYVRIHLFNGKSYLCDYPIRNLEEKLDDKFVRIQRSILVNRTRIKEIEKHYSGRYVVKLNDTAVTKLTSGKNYSEQIKKLLEI